MKYIISFLGSLAANLLSLAVFFLIVPAFAVAAIFAFLMAQLGLAPSGTPDNAAIVLNLSDSVCEFAPPTDALSNLKRGGAASSVLSICSKIEAAARDDSNKLVFISGSFDCAAEDVSYAQIAELRAALRKYAESGKEVVAYLENPSTRDYFLASAATTVFLNPFSELEFKGLGGNAAFFGNALKKYGVEVEVVKVGALKSFGEMFTSDKMSEPVRENYAGLLDSVWNSVLESVAKSRKISAAALAGVAEKKAVLSAADALAARLVDRLAYRDEVIDYISEKVGADGVSFAQISVADYEFPECGPDCVGVVAVVYLNGEISAAKPANDIVDAATYCVLLRELRFDENVKAVVLRVNSGGGSAYESESIRREVELLAKAKPVVASFGGISASGAYWISTAANKIYADAESITGSIGVFSLLFSAEKLAADFGITFDGAKTAPMSDIGTFSRRPTNAEIARIRAATDTVYSKFVSLVSSSRKIPRDAVLKLADGRVFSGAAAKKLKLVDEIGGLSEAVEYAKKASKCENACVAECPQRDAVRDLLDMVSEGGAPFAKSVPIKTLERFKKLAETKRRSAVYTRTPLDFKIR